MIVRGNKEVVSRLCAPNRLNRKSKKPTVSRHLRILLFLLSRQKRPTVYLVVVYRPPSSSVTTFIDEFTSLLESCVLDGHPIILSGDFNIHWDNQENSSTRQIRDLFEAFGLQQHVSESTHIKGHILDYIVTRDTDNLQISDICVGDMISDHNLVSCSFLFSKPHQKPRVISYRRIKDIDIDLLKADLSDSPLLQNHEASSLDDLVAMYNHELQLLLDKHAPFNRAAYGIDHGSLGGPRLSHNLVKNYDSSSENGENREMRMI